MPKPARQGDRDCGTSRLAGNVPNPDCFHCLQAQDFPEVAQLITEAIAELGGAVVPKLNWSCPQAGDGDNLDLPVACRVACKRGIPWPLDCQKG